MLRAGATIYPRHGQCILGVNMEIWHGCHNTFLVRHDNVLSPVQMRTLAQQHRVDGVICIAPGNPPEMLFFNPDGTRDNCGNGLRVAAAYCFEKRLCKRTGVLRSRGLSFPFAINRNSVQVLFPQVRFQRGIWIVGKVPHKVIAVEDFEKGKLQAAALRKRFCCNITLVKQLSAGVFAQTFEVGVERFTASCGTGAIAAALASGEQHIYMPGGLLRVQQKDRGILMSGGVEKVKCL